MRALALVSTLALTLAGCAISVSRPARSSASPHDQLYLDFETQARVGDVLGTVTNRGTARVRVRVARSAGGVITADDGADGGRSARFPAYARDGSGAAAIIVVRPSKGDDLDPGDHDLAFGADVRLDDVSSGSATDDGDNVVQRGGYASTGQFKLQVDHGVPSCRITGDDGGVFVKAREALTRGSWYRVTCRRSDQDVTLSVSQLGVAGSKRTRTTHGRTGHLSLTRLPLSVGGKVTEGGDPSESADQFNGWLDNVFVSIG